MRLALLLVLASLSASAAEPKPCAKEEAEHDAAAVAFMRALEATRDAERRDSSQEMYAAHNAEGAAARRLGTATDALKKCRAAKAVKP